MNNCRKNSTLKILVKIYKVVGSGNGNLEENFTKAIKTELFKEFAILKTLKGVELLGGDNNILSIKTHKLTFAYNSQSKLITDKNYLLFNNKFYKIDQMVNTDERNIEIVVFCSFIANV